MKKTVAHLLSVAVAFAVCSCQSTSSKTAKSENSSNSQYGTYQQPNQSYQGANPYAGYGSGNSSTYNNNQFPPPQPLPQDSDYVSVTPTNPQYQTPPPQPQYQAAAQSPQMGSYQEAAHPLPSPTYDTAASQPAYQGQTVAQTHTVQRGETLYGISRMYGTSVNGIKGANGLHTDIIHPGDVLSVR